MCILISAVIRGLNQSRPAITGSRWSNNTESILKKLIIDALVSIVQARLPMNSKDVRRLAFLRILDLAKWSLDDL